MLRGIIAFALLGVTLALNFAWQDCDSDPNRAIQISSITVSPSPVVMPGPVTFSFTAKLTKPIEGGRLELELKRHVPIFGYVHVPCVLGVGSCPVDFCAKLSHLNSSPVGKDIQKIITDNQLKATCPLQPQSATVTQATINIPNPGAVASVIAAGDYKIKAVVKDKSNQIVGCVSLDVELKRQHHGFLFG